MLLVSYVGTIITRTRALEGKIIRNPGGDETRNVLECKAWKAEKTKTARIG
jgi:hypothetical protein